MMSKMLTVPQVAAQTGLAQVSIRVAIHRGRLKAVKGKGGRNAIPAAELKRYMDEIAHGPRNAAIITSA
jgi:excisionase family DNA binding protein